MSKKLKSQSTIPAVAAKPKYDNWSKEQLIDEVARLRKRKKYGLVWEEKLENVVEQCKTELPVLKEVKNKAIAKDKNGPVNILIEGDNYHALSVLNYTHKGKIDVIYIDPPYNTGARDWKYNNDYVDVNDQWRHSKWILMMEHRLQLTKKLLSQNGFIICAIDHNELFALGLLMDEIFGESNRLGTITVVHKPEGRQFANFFSPSNEFMLVYAKNRTSAQFENIVLSKEKADEFDLVDEKGKYKLQNFIRLTDGKYSLRKNKPEGYYPIYVSNDLAHFSLTKKKGYDETLPITNKGVERVWKTFGDTFMDKVGNEAIVAKRENGKIVLYEKLRPSEVLVTHWIKKQYHGYHFGTKLLETILGKKLFDFPKSLYLVLDILKLTTRRNAIILDFFAGSGTTGHAVLELNKEDGGNRRFILCTNNENNIATEVCYPRVAKVIDGYKDAAGKTIAGIKSNLKYFRTAFVGAEPNDKNKEALTKKATEMLCMREDTFESVKETGAVKIFKNSKQHTGIIFDEDAIPALKKEIVKIDGAWSIYIFSLGDDTFEDEFEDMKQKITVAPIPEAILRVYRRIFKP